MSVSGSQPALDPPYEILGELSRSDRTVIYQARMFDRLVAAKMLLDSELLAKGNFMKEPQALVRSRHRHVVDVLDIGNQGGRLYFTMEFVGGGNLDNRLTGIPVPTSEAIQTIVALAGAVHFMHEQGMVHLDIHPAHVLVASDGLPKLIGFGRVEELDKLPNRQGGIAGTPPYLAPEQVRGDFRQMGPATDIYALGGMLYELITGRPPFKGENILDTLSAVMEGDPTPPSRLQSCVTHDLDAICLKCLAKEPQNRFSSAQALAEELSWL